MKVYLLMYRPHERAGYEVLQAYISQSCANAALECLMMGHKTGASSGCNPFYIKDVDTVD